MQHLEGSGTPVLYIGRTVLTPLNAELNPICHLLTLLGAHHILHVNRIWVKYVEQCFSTFVRPRPGKFFFHKTRARSQQIYS
jgi:hypothetical protein